MARKIISNPQVGQFLCFAMIGAGATVIQYAVLYSLVEKASLAPVTAAVIAYLCGATTTYLLNSRITFRDSPQALAASATRYMIVNLTGLLINTLIFRALLKVGWYYLAAQAVATIVVLGWNFAGSRLYVFRSSLAD